MTNVKEIEEFIRMLEEQFRDENCEAHKRGRKISKEDPELPDAPPIQMITETFSGLLVNGHKI